MAGPGAIDASGAGCVLLPPDLRTFTTRGLRADFALSRVP
jgi:hypothetical protein